MKKILILLMPAVLLIAASHADEPAAGSEVHPLTLEAAISRATSSHPALSAAESEWLAAQAEALQAGLRPNPVFGIEAENVGGSGVYSGLDSAEYTFSLSQSLELGGKRKKRAQAAQLLGQVAGWSREELLRAVEQATIRAFFTVLAEQSRLELSTQQVELAQSVVDKAQQRVDAGRANRLEVTKARIELADAQLEHDSVAVALKSDKQLLAALWGGSGAEIGMLEGDLAQVDAPKPVAELAVRLKEHPAYREAEAEIRRLQVVVAVEDAQRIPDVDVSAGLRMFEESDEQAFVVGVAVPLTFGNRNQGNREAARIRVLQAEDRRSAVRLELYQVLLEKSRAVQAAYETVSSLQTQQVPIAKEAFAQASDGYEKGLFGSLDLLAAMRGLFEQETRYVNALLDYHLARAELGSLIAPAHESNTKQF